MLTIPLSALHEYSRPGKFAGSCFCDCESFTANQAVFKVFIVFLSLPFASCSDVSFLNLNAFFNVSDRSDYSFKRFLCMNSGW